VIDVRSVVAITVAIEGLVGASHLVVCCPLQVVDLE